MTLNSYFTLNSGWLFRVKFTRPQTVTHRSTNRAQYTLIANLYTTPAKSTVLCVLVLLTATKCQKNLLLTKNRLTNADDFVEFSETSASSCDTSERFYDGMDKENIKCTTTHERVGVWSRTESACHGTTYITYVTSLHITRRPLTNVKRMDKAMQTRRMSGIILF